MRHALLACAVALAFVGCASHEEPPPKQEEPDPPLKPDPLGIKLLKQMPTALQLRECSRRVRTTLDLGGWELRQWPMRDDSEGVRFELLYAKRGEEIRMIGRPDEIAALVARWPSPDSVREFRALLDRERAAGVELRDPLGEPVEEAEAKDLEAKTGLRDRIDQEGDTIVAQRLALQSCWGADRVVCVREFFGPHRYATEIAAVLQTTLPEDGFVYTAALLRKHGEKIASVAAGSWNLWLAPTDPEMRVMPASRSLFAEKDGEVRRILWMDELASLDGGPEGGADAADLCRLPAEVAANELFSFEEEHGWVPTEEWGDISPPPDLPGQATWEKVAGGWSVERVTCQPQYVGDLVRIVVVRDTFIGGRVRSETVRLVRQLVPILHTYE